MGIPQILIIALASVGLLISANQHGKQKEKKENVWVTLTAIAIQISLLIWGGFFS